MTFRDTEPPEMPLDSLSVTHLLLGLQHPLPSVHNYLFYFLFLGRSVYPLTLFLTSAVLWVVAWLSLS